MIRWWLVACTACRWANDRRGTRADVTRFSCPRCGAKVTATPGFIPKGLNTITFPENGPVGVQSP
jgi:hypothetical protein